MVIQSQNKKIEEVLTRGVEKILPSKEGLAALMKKRKIRLYLGIDPTSPKLHLGHTIPLRKLREFQDLGHQAVLLFGTFTAQIGDPSGRKEKRKPLTPLQIRKNMAEYKEQVAKVVNISKIIFKSNADWLANLKFSDIVELSSHFTVSRLLERDMFQERLREGGEVWVSEFLYPLMQGYDSVAMDVDLEIGASDQLFNMLVGRKLQKIYHQKEKFVLTIPLLPGLDGRKMSKTYGNTVNLDDSPNEMYGKLMSLRDELILPYFELCTELPFSEIKEMQKKLKKGGLNPRDAKARLAREIVQLYHTEKKALEAEKEFKKVFKQKGLPQGIPVLFIKEKELPIVDVLIKAKLASSKTEAKRLILQKGVRIDGKRELDWQKVLHLKRGMIVQVGRRRFVKIEVYGEAQALNRTV